MVQQTWTHFKPLFPIQPSSEQVLTIQSLNESFCNCLTPAQKMAELEKVA
jgi:hypothetical protein